MKFILTPSQLNLVIEQYTGPTDLPIGSDTTADADFGNKQNAGLVYNSATGEWGPAPTISEPVEGWACKKKQVEYCKSKGLVARTLKISGKALNQNSLGYSSPGIRGGGYDDDKYYSQCRCVDPRGQQSIGQGSDKVLSDKEKAQSAHQYKVDLKKFDDLGKSSGLDIHTKLDIIALAFFWAPPIAIGIELINAGTYLEEGNGLVGGTNAAFGLLPFVPSSWGKEFLKRIGIKNINETRKRIVNNFKNNKPLSSQDKITLNNLSLIPQEKYQIAQQYLNKINKLKPNYIANQGIDAYNSLSQKFINGQITKEGLLSSLKSTKSKNVQSYLLNKSNDELIDVLNSKGILEKGWYTFGRGFDAAEHSGWKFHIFGEDLVDSAFLIDKLEPIAKKYNATAKVGGPDHMGLPSMQIGQLQYGKQGVTMYIPKSVIEGGKHRSMLSDIESAIKGYGEHPFTKGGTILGDNMITPQIHYRYELTGPIPPGGLKNHDHYLDLYNTNSSGPYKPNDVKDIFD